MRRLLVSAGATVAALSLVAASIGAAPANGLSPLGASFVCEGQVFAAMVGSGGGVIPDADADGLRTGALRLDVDRAGVERVLVSIDLSHSYVGDLLLSIELDDDRDGETDRTFPLEIYLASSEPCGEAMYAYPIVLDGRYWFRLEGIPPAAIASGSWTLVLVDRERGDRGVLRGWALHAPVIPRSGGGMTSVEGAPPLGASLLLSDRPGAAAPLQ